MAHFKEKIASTFVAMSLAITGYSAGAVAQTSNQKPSTIESIRGEADGLPATAPAHYSPTKGVWIKGQSDNVLPVRSTQHIEAIEGQHDGKAAVSSPVRTRQTDQNVTPGIAAIPSLHD